MTGKFAGWCRVKSDEDLVCNYDGFGNEMVYRVGVNYRYDYETLPNYYDPPTTVKVFIGQGFLYFSKNKFDRLFDHPGNRNKK